MKERKDFWAAAALYSILTLVLTFPLSATAHRTLPADDPDGHLFMWTLAWDAHALVHQPLSIFDANIFYPNRNSLALSENLIGSAVFAAPVLWLTANPVLAVNIVSLFSCMLCGLGAYVLGRRLGLTVAASLLAGLIFAFAPPRFFRFSQLHLTAVQWIPFMLASLHGYLDEGQRRHLWMAIGFFTLQVLASGHGAVFAAVAILILIGYRAMLGEPFRIMQRLRDAGVVGALLLDTIRGDHHSVSNEPGGGRASSCPGHVGHADRELLCIAHSGGHLAALAVDREGHQQRRDRVVVSGIPAAGAQRDRRCVRRIRGIPETQGTATQPGFAARRDELLQATAARVSRRGTGCGSSLARCRRCWQAVA